MTTIFSKIIAREIPGKFVYEDDVCVVVMDKFASVTGQTLVIPRQETDYIFDLPEDIYTHIFNVAKKIAQASDRAFSTRRTCLIVEGFEVLHVHIKLYPIVERDHGIATIMSRKKEWPDDELIEAMEKIKAELTQ